MENVTRGLPEGPARRAARVAQVGARYGFGYVFGRRFLLGRRRRDVGRVGTRLRFALEELGPTFVELGHVLSTRRDVLPPDVTAELERASVPVAPVPFAEVRALVERELGNTLERLFMKFGEAPVRAGVLTQAHQVVLPGEHPALVVVRRPGVRGDLLAMRPVADVVRRRVASRPNGGGLPLDPATAVGEFAAYVAQRRDMFFAAQTARRLREVEGFALRVPGVYRRYSTARCVTFEAPAEAEPLGAEGYREVSGALVGLAILEGIYFADLAPERFVLGGDGEIWLSDPTEASALDPERLRGVAEVLAAVRRGDVDFVIRALPLAGCTIPRDTRVLQRELRDVLGSLGGPLWREHSLAEIRARGLEAARRGNATLPAEVAHSFDSLVKAERLGRVGAHEERNVTGTAAEAAEELISRYQDPRYVAARTARKLAQGDTYAEYPRQIHDLLNELKDGEVEVVFRHRGLDELISKVDILANRLVFAFLIAALVIGSSLLSIFGETGVRFLGVSVFGLLGFVIAALLGLALLVGIVRSRRL